MCSSSRENQDTDGASAAQGDGSDVTNSHSSSLPEAHTDGPPEVELMTVESLRASQPLLDHLPHPVMWIARDHRVLWCNRAALQQFDAEATHCYSMSHGHAEPCSSHGESCPKERAETDGRAFSVGHVHTTAIGMELFKVTAVPLVDGSVVEFQVPLDDVLGRDKLTGCYVRSFFEQLLLRQLALLRRIQECFCILMLDCDHLKEFNDQHGHLAGDRALESLGGVMRESIRESDIIGRWGGDEFCIFLPATDAKGGLAQAQRLHEAIRSLPLIHGRRVTASIGVAAASTTTDFPVAMAGADRAMYKAKQAGRDRIRVAE